MADPSDDIKFDKGKGKEKQASGQQGQSGTGQADLGSQAGSTIAGHADQQNLGDVGGKIDQPASHGRIDDAYESDAEGEGFLLQQGGGSDDLQASSAKTAGGTDFAPQGRGAAEEEEEDGEGHPS